LAVCMFIETKPATSLDVAAGIKGQAKGVTVADGVYGRCAAVVQIEAPTLERVNDVVYKVIEKDPT
jgi:hypothetical protein